MKNFFQLLSKWFHDYVSSLRLLVWGKPMEYEEYVYENEDHDNQTWCEEYCYDYTDGDTDAVVDNDGDYDYYMENIIIKDSSLLMPVLAMPFDEFINNGISDKGQLMVNEHDNIKILSISHPSDKYDTKITAVYDDGRTKDIDIVGTIRDTREDGMVVNEHITNAISIIFEKCYLVDLTISLIDKDTKISYDVDVDPIYDYDIHAHMNPIDYFSIFTDAEYTNEVPVEIILESSIYTIKTDTIENGKIFIHPEPEDGTYLIKVYDKENNIIDEKTFDFNREECFFDYDKEKTGMVTLYKLSDENSDAIVLRIEE